MKVATISLRTFASSLLLPVAVGGAAALLSGAGSERYAALPRPPLAPPGWIFPAVWTLLYLLMGYAAYRIRSVHSIERAAALRTYYVQLALNALWPILFFRFGLVRVAAVLLGVLILAALLTALRFRRIDRTAAVLLIPYLIWMLFALYLNLGTAVLVR